MLLVVYSHVIHFGYGPLFTESGKSFNTVIGAFFMQLFFFICGFVTLKDNLFFTPLNTLHFLKAKFQALIIPAIFFGCLYLYLFNIPLRPLLLSETKGGYWFTLSLFQFYLFFSLFMLLLKNLTQAKLNMILISLSFVLYAISTPKISIDFFNINADFVKIIGVVQWRFFPFFIAGILVRKSYTHLENLLKNSYISGGIITLFFCSAICGTLYPSLKNGANYHVYFLLIGSSGSMLFFQYFHKYSSSIMMYKYFSHIGLYTLEIYLLHYFFLPRNLQFIGNFFIDSPSLVLEMFVSMIIAILVIIVCLATSSFIKVSDRLGQLLFGR